MRYRKVHVQLVSHDAGAMAAMCRDKRPATGAQAMDEVICDLVAQRFPRLEYPVYVSAGEEEGDLVEVPYGTDFTAVGLALGEVGADELLDGVEYKAVSRVLAKAADYGREAI